jgi:hypothetical protein
MQVITPQEWQEWASNPVTKQFVNDMRVARQAIMEAWAGRAYQALGNETALGKVEAYRELIDAIEEEYKNAK